MRLSRVFVDAALVSGARVMLRGSAAGHVTRVLRLRPGAALTLFNGTGGEFAGRIEAAHGDAVTVALGQASATERESPLALTLAQGISRGERMDLVVQKATELGVVRLLPLLTERSVVRLDARQAARKLAHWRGITIAACEQSGRNRLPQVAEPLELREFLQAKSEGTRLLLSRGLRLALPTCRRRRAPSRCSSALRADSPPRNRSAPWASGFSACA